MTDGTGVNLSDQRGVRRRALRSIVTAYGLDGGSFDDSEVVGLRQVSHASPDASSAVPILITRLYVPETKKAVPDKL